MSEKKIDPRVLRTRKLIMDSFIDLSAKKEFKDITIKDITTEAMINRTTFYYHFEDIYDLLEKALSEILSVNLNYEAYENMNIDEAVLIRMFETITDFQQSLSTRCTRGYEETIARIIKEQLEVVLYKMLVKQHDSGADDDSLQRVAVLLSWGLYGSSAEWKRQPNTVPEDYIKSVIPYILSGIDSREN